ncbi:MAG TPA: hypothetical protein DCO86_01485 [Spirochaetaceae bacterium]|nr:hypothetical protein [Spirochaetaceae bacterium]
MRQRKHTSANSPANAKTPDKSQTIMGNPKFSGDPIMKSAGGDPVMRTAAGDPIMLEGKRTAGGDPIMLNTLKTAGGDPIMMDAKGNAYILDAAGDPVMLSR